MKKKIFIPVYGGGHCKLIISLYDSLIRKFDVTILALTLAEEYLSNHEIPYKTLKDYLEYIDDSDYFDKIGVSFEIYHCINLNGKNYFSFRKNDSDKWVKISDKVASYILAQNDIVINGLCDSVASCCQYDCYYNVNLKGG